MKQKRTLNESNAHIFFKPKKIMLLVVLLCALVVLLYTLVVIFGGFFGVFDNMRISYVEVSQLANMTPLQIKRIEYAVKELEYHSSVVDFHSGDPNTNRYEFYGLRFVNNRNKSTDRISVYTYPTAEIAAGRFTSYEYLTDNTGGKHKHIQFDNGINIIVKSTDWSGMFFHNCSAPSWKLDVYILIGDTIICCSESGSYGTAATPATNDFIKTLYSIARNTH